MKLRPIFSALLLPILIIFSSASVALEPNGTAGFSELGKQLYLGTLFLDTPSKSAADILASSQKKRMEIRFTDGMSKRRWAQNWTQSIAINSARETMVAAADDLSATLSAFQGNLEYGDQVVIEYDPLFGTSVAVNGVALVKERSADLFTLFLSSWIGPVPPSSQFKAALLGEDDSKNDYTAFMALSPSPARVAAVKSWGASLQKAEEELAKAEEIAVEEAKKAEEEAMKKAEEDAQKKAEEEAMAEETRLALIEEEKKKAQEAARKQAEEEAAKREAERQTALAEAAKAKEAEQYSVESILAQQDYTTQIIRKIYKSVSYPSAAVKKNIEGSVRASVVIGKDGGVTKVAIMQASGNELLDKAALSAINAAAPFPPIPDKVKDSSIELMVPIAFKLD